MNSEGPHLLSLPLELRELIYKEVLLDPSQGPQILRVCREICSEARKFLYQRSIVFQSQSDLHRWLEQRPEEVLQDVQEIQLELQDVDLMPILASASSDDQSERRANLSTWKLYEGELETLDRSFKKLPNAKTLTIRALTGRQTHLYDEFLAKVLQMLGVHYPALQDLSLEGNTHNQSLNFLPPLEALTAFSFDGFAASETAETAAILSGLNLTHISIVSQPALLTPTRGQHSSFTLKPPTFDRSFLHTITQLASFAVTESVPTPTSSPLFFNSEIFSSLHNHKTLSALSLRLSQTPDEDTLDGLGDFLKKTDSVERLELDWPHLDPTILYILTNKLKSLWIRASNSTAACDILDVILESKEDGDLERLRRVVLIRKGWDIVGETSSMNSDGGEEEPSGGDVSLFKLTLVQRLD